MTYQQQLNGRTRLYDDQHEPPTIKGKGEREGERKRRSSCEDGPTRDETATSAVSEGNEDARNNPKKLQNTSQHVRERLKQKVEGNSPSGAQEELGDPSEKQARPETTTAT